MRTISRNEKIDAKEDLEDVLIHECLLNVATFLSFTSKGKLTYVELNSGSLEADTKRKRQRGRKARKIDEHAKGRDRMDWRGRSSDPSASRDAEYESRHVAQNPWDASVPMRCEG